MWEVSLNLKGSGRIVAGGREFDFVPGTVMCIPPHVFHFKESDKPFRDIHFLAESFTLPMGNDVGIFQDDEKKRIEALMFLAMDFFNEDEKKHYFTIEAICSAIYHILCNQSNKDKKNDTIDAFINEIVKNHKNPDFDLNGAIKNTAYNDAHFRRIFKEYTGVSPGTYLNYLRTDCAKALLVQKSISGKDMTQIALESGFYDKYYFTRVFKSMVGKSPKEYINSRKR